MVKETEILEYVDKIFNDCIQIKHIDYEYIINCLYNKDINRLEKLNKLFNKKSESEYDPDDINLSTIFQINHKQKTIYIDDFRFSRKFKIFYIECKRFTDIWIKLKPEMKDYKKIEYYIPTIKF